jgi:hypothetical protein
MAVLSRAFLLRLATCSLALLVLAGSAFAQARAVPLESQVKAAYLFKFSSFVEWPEGSFARPDSPLLIGVAGDDVLAEQLGHMVAGRSVGGHALAVQRVRSGEAVDGLHILFIGATERAAMRTLLEGARGHGVLTVCDADDGLAQGCMIGFVVSQERLRFDVALKQVNASRLRISARMLAVANRVQGAS